MPSEHRPVRGAPPREPSEPLLGRAADVAALLELFEEGARLVTIVGPGGMGKTRLAGAVAVEAAPAFVEGGGATFVDLTSATTAGGFAALVARELGVRLRASRDPGAAIEQLARALGRRGRALLVLDNFEQLADVAVETVGALLAGAPRARVLVTSRRALELADEHRWPLEGLALPPAREARGTRDEVLSAPAVALFVRRARQLRPSLALDEDAVDAIVGIVARVEGMPLAIELAAARVAALSPQQILERLSARRDEILARSGGAPPRPNALPSTRTRDDGRHASMRGVVAESFRLLSERERRCLLGCGVFDGGMSLEAIDAVVGPDSALPAVEGLVASSLVRLVRSPELGDEPRFALYEVIREYARGELDATPELASELRRRHARYFAEVAARLPRARLSLELANCLVAAAELTATTGEAADAARALELTLAIEPILLSHGLLAARAKVLDDALGAASRSGVGSSAALRARIARGHTQGELGARSAAREDYEAALVAGAAIGDDEVLALAHARLGALVETTGDTAAARGHFQTALEAVARLAPGPATRAREAAVRAALVHAYRREGRLADAEREVLGCIGAYRVLGDEEGLCATVGEAGVLALFAQRYDEARARFDEALALARRIGARTREAAILTATGTMLQELGELDRARELHEAAVGIYRDAGTPYAEASTVYYLAGTQLERGQRGDAETLLQTALAAVRAIGVPRYEALLLGLQAALFADDGRDELARETFAEADRAAVRCASEPALLATLSIHRLHLPMRGASPAEAEVLCREGAELAGRHGCDDPRFALRALQLSATARRAEDGLAIGPEGRAFRLPGASGEIDLSRRAPLSRILHALARRRIDAPGEALRVEDLLAAGWPGERVRFEAGANRVYVALTELRKLGLRDFVLSDQAGYRLTTSRPVTLEATLEAALET